MLQHDRDLLLTTTSLDEQPSTGRLFAIGFAVGGLAAVMWYAWQSLSHTAPPPKPVVQQVSLIKPPPPPPPPPEQKIQPPEAQKIAEPPPLPEPEEAPEPEPPPAGDLGLDAEGSAGSDAFGLAARKGGRGLIGGGGSGNAVIWYGQKLGAELGDAVRAALADTAHAQAFSAVAQVWVAADGRVERAELAGSTGDRAIDERLRALLSRIELRLAQAPPSNMPQPVRIRLNARG